MEGQGNQQGFMQHEHDQQVPPNGESIEQQQQQRELLSLVTTNDFTPIQMHIVISRIKGQSYSQIKLGRKVII